MGAGPLGVCRDREAQRLTTTMAETLRARYAALPGSTHIASAFACAGLAVWLDRRRPRYVYEAGGGIGTLSLVALTALREFDVPRLQYQMEERDPWCLTQWKNHIGPLASEGVVLTTEWIAPRQPFDFVILDGPSGPYWEWLAHRAVIFVEGNRRPQRAALEAVLRGRRGLCRAHWKPQDRSKGYWVYQLDPTRLELLRCLAVRLRETLRDGFGRLSGRALGKKRR